MLAFFTIRAAFIEARKETCWFLKAIFAASNIWVCVLLVNIDSQNYVATRQSLHTILTTVPTFDVVRE